jgi:XTP/dITP diphosphohydrolase
LKVLLATGNRKKAAEMEAILGEGGNHGLEFMSLADYPGLPPVVEDGTTFVENARKKAEAAARATGLPTVGEDSGIEVDALGGAPGIFSARYSGEGADDRTNSEKLLDAMRDVPAGKRGARYRCAAVLFFPDGREEVAEGSCAGEIACAPRGTGGFGYDPIFLLASGRMMAELSPGEKHAISHRGVALRRIREKLVGAINFEGIIGA